MIGVNCRDLRTFDEDLEVAQRVATRIPPDVTAVAESGLRSVDDAHRVVAAGYRAALVGEALVRADDPAMMVKTFTQVPVTIRR